jgi:carboxyl-terminal processing protease
MTQSRQTPRAPCTRRGPADGRRRGLRRTLASIVLVPLVPLIAGAFLLQGRAGADGERIFYEVVSRINSSAVEPVSEAELYERAARGLLANIGDPHADLFSPEQLEEFSRQTLRNSYAGLGMQIQSVRDTAVVMRTFPGSPAEGGGVRPADRIVEVDGESVVGMPLQQVTDRLLGVPGTRVAVTFVRPGAPDARRELTRARIRNPVAPFSVVLDGGIGYLPLRGFNDSSAEDLRLEVEALRRDGARAFVLDLRGNPGGSLDQGIRITDLFLDPGQQIVRVEYRNQPVEVANARRRAAIGDAPLVVLTDEGSASAAEIVAGALQDHDRAVVLGTPTVGKGLVQQLFELNGGWALKLTTGKWYTPSGRLIQRPLEQVNGRWVEVDPDTAGTPRPEYRSTGGRLVYGGGGVTPDLVLAADTLVGAERELMRLLAAHGAPLYEALTEVSLDRSRGARRDFAVDPAWRDEVFRLLASKGVVVERPAFDAGAGVLDRAIERRIAELAHGEAASFKRAAAYDNQLQAALRLLSGARAQGEVFARVPTAVAVQE